MAEHVYQFSREWSGGKRLCGECRQTYEQGEHQHVAVLKPYTSYICPSGGGYGHSSRWSGSQDVPELRGPDDDLCICGERMIEEDAEVWRLTFDMLDPNTGDRWIPVKRDGTKHSTHEQRDGLLTMPDEIRNIELRKVGD